MHEFIQNQYVQLAVIMSGLLTLILLIFQGYRYILKPTYKSLRMGVVTYARTASERRNQRIKAALDDTRLLVIRSFLLLFMMLVSLINFLVAQFLGVLVQFLYLPNFTPNLLNYEVMNKEALVIAVTVVSWIAIFFVFVSLGSALSFFAGALRQLQRQASGK